MIALTLLLILVGPAPAEDDTALRSTTGYRSRNRCVALSRFIWLISALSALGSGTLVRRGASPQAAKVHASFPGASRAAPACPGPTVT